LAEREYGTSVLMQAAEEGHVDCVKLLLYAQANPDAGNTNCNTALHCALKAKYVEVASVIRAFVKDRDAARAFARGTRDARAKHRVGHWTDSNLCDVHLVAEITAFVTPAKKKRKGNQTTTTTAAAATAATIAAQQQQQQQPEHKQQTSI
jgi:hypothetical protein